MTYTYKRMTDSDGREYKEVDYNEYLKSENKHRIFQCLKARYFVEVDSEPSQKTEDSK